MPDVPGGHSVGLNPHLRQRILRDTAAKLHALPSP